MILQRGRIVIAKIWAKTKQAHENQRKISKEEFSWIAYFAQSAFFLCTVNILNDWFTLWNIFPCHFINTFMLFFELISSKIKLQIVHFYLKKSKWDQKLWKKLIKIQMFLFCAMHSYTIYVKMNSIFMRKKIYNLFYFNFFFFT